jgi:hypothetical protein
MGVIAIDRCAGSLYNLGQAPLIVFFHNKWGVHLCCGFPCIVRFRIALPLNEVVELFVSSTVALISDGLDLVFGLAFDDIWGRSCEVFTVLSRFLIRGEDAGVKHRMYCPLRGEF